MKKRHSVTHSVKQFCKMIREGQVVFDYPLQRDKNQWTNYQKSLLIYSLATDYAVPEIYSVGITEQTAAGFTQTNYSVLDGKQRLTSINEFLQEEYALHADTPRVRIGDHLYDMAGCYFHELHPTVQDAINDYTLIMCHFINTTDDELAEMFYFLNNGTAMSNQQKAKARMGLQTARTLNELVTHPFLTDCVTMTAQQRKRAGDEQILVQAMMLADPEVTTTSLSSKDITEYATTLKSGKEALLTQVEQAMNYLVEVCSDKHELFKKKHAPYILHLAMQADEKAVPYALFLQWMDTFVADLVEETEEESFAMLYKRSVDGKNSNRKVQVATSSLNAHFEQKLALLS